MKIAIDGPAGAGKSSVAKGVAKAMNAIYIDTGAMYRAMAIYILRTGTDITDAEAVAETAEQADVTITYEEGSQHVWLNGEDVTAHLREEAVGNMASAVSGNARLRAHLVRTQQKLAESCDVVMDGRDIGTVVLPNADVKVFLTASSEKRAERRFLQDHEGKTESMTPEEKAAEIERIRLDIEERDQRDMNREASPLRQADDAVLLDSSELSIEEVIEIICSLADEEKSRR
ncbi:MAG: (d)CMP kinase [Lachnospiraceae bacterium]|nr:(d)CMP kinase [Lachnospiraceae bacterium]